MIVKQLADCLISLNRFDSGEPIEFSQGVEMDVDDATGEFLLSLRCIDESGQNAADFINVEQSLT